MVKLVDRYIGRAAILGILAVWLMLTVLFMVFGLLGELRGTENDYSSLDALWFTGAMLVGMFVFHRTDGEGVPAAAR